jgi:NDP-sugar pyrophosphorylase family protein
MRFAILAAGEGARLVQEGVTVPKPLVKVNGERLVDRLCRIFMACGAAEIDLVVNDLHPQTLAHLREKVAEGLPLRWVVKTTPSSMHSMFELLPLLEGDEPFILTTVDTVFDEQEFKTFVSEWTTLAASETADGLMGVTDYIDDEKPLYVSVDKHREIEAFLDETPHPHYVSGGIYGLTPRAFSSLRDCMEKGESRMRNFQRALLRDGSRLKAWVFSKVIDVDHVGDIVKAGHAFPVSSDAHVRTWNRLKEEY